MTRFKEILTSGKFVVTVELDPPKGVNTQPFVEAVNLLKGRVDAFNVPDNRSACIGMSSVAGAVLVRNHGAESICTFACRDRNRMALCSDLLGMYSLGIENVLMVTGDYFSFGDTPQSKPVFDLDSVQAVRMARELEQGNDAGGNVLDGTPSFYIGGVANPQANPMAPHFNKFLKKIRAGVEFIQTLDVYDMKRLDTFMSQAKKENVPIIVGIRVVDKRTVDLQLLGKLSGNPIPDSWIHELADLDERSLLESGKRKALELIKSVQMSGLAAGVHLSAGDPAACLPEILSEAGI